MNESPKSPVDTIPQERVNDWVTMAEAAVTEIFPSEGDETPPEDFAEAQRGDHHAS